MFAGIQAGNAANVWNQFESNFDQKPVQVIKVISKQRSN